MRRNAISQRIHDLVIEALAAELDGAGHDVYTNPGSEKNCEVEGTWPDAVVLSGSLSAEDEDDDDDVDIDVEAIYEVETADSVTEVEARTQWGVYAEFGFPFTLVVPRDCESDADEILEHQGIDADVLTYAVDDDGEVTFDWDEE